jgi:methylated-DNA-[protein]-cysteine S-methyltransferase
MRVNDIMVTSKRQNSTESNDTLLVFASDLGWMAAVVADGAVKQLSFGHPSAAAARKALDRKTKTLTAGKPGKGDARLVRRLQAYAAGIPDALGDIPVDFGGAGEFQRRVLEQCRRIPYGRTMSYGELAAKAGSPRAARAVGNCMAANKTPLLVPCHRVVHSGGRIGSFSAPGGASTKRRLLAMESDRAGLAVRTT